MKYLITATTQDGARTVKQEAGSERAMKEWLRAYRINRWKVKNVKELK